MTLIFAPTLFTSRLCDVKANGQRLQTLMFCQMITGRFTFLDVRVWQQNFVDFPLFVRNVGAFGSVLKKKKCVKVQYPALQMHHDISVKPFIQGVPSVPSLSDWKEGCVISTGSCHQNPSTFFNHSHQNATERVIFIVSAYLSVSSDRGEVARTVVFKKNRSVLRSVSEAQNAFILTHWQQVK